MIDSFDDDRRWLIDDWLIDSFIHSFSFIHIFYSIWLMIDSGFDWFSAQKSNHRGKMAHNTHGQYIRNNRMGDIKSAILVYRMVDIHDTVGTADVAYLYCIEVDYLALPPATLFAPSIHLPYWRNAQLKSRDVLYHYILVYASKSAKSPYIYKYTTV